MLGGTQANTENFTATSFPYDKNWYIGIDYSIEQAPHLLTGFGLIIEKEGKTCFKLTVKDKTKKPGFQYPNEGQAQVVLAKILKDEHFQINDYSFHSDITVIANSTHEALRFVNFFHANILAIDEKALLEMIAFLEKGLPSEVTLFERIHQLAHQGHVQKAFEEALSANQMGFPDCLYKLGLVFLDLKRMQPAYACFCCVQKGSNHFNQAQLRAAKLCPHVLKADGKSTNEILSQAFKHALEAGPEGQSVIDSHFLQACGFPDNQIPAALINIQPNVETLITLANVIATQNAELTALREKCAEFSVKIEIPK